MRLICPHCQGVATVPDDAAGKDASCPNCGRSFPTPARYAASVSPETTPPGYVPPPTGSSPSLSVPPAPPGYVGPSGFLDQSATSTPLQPSGYTRSCGITISPKVVEWLPAVLLTLTFFLTFFPWVGSYIGDGAMYSQGPWWAAAGSAHRNIDAEKVAPAGTTGWPSKENLHSDWFLILFLLLLIVTTAVAIAERASLWFNPQKFPPITKVWPKRFIILAALSAAALALLVSQSLYGFSLERAAEKYVYNNEALVKEREAAQGNEWKLNTVKYKEEQELARFNLKRTPWLHLAVACTTIAALASIGLVLFERRGNKPPPKILLHY